MKMGGGRGGGECWIMMWLLGVRWLHDMYGMAWDGMPMG